MVLVLVSSFPRKRESRHFSLSLWERVGVRVYVQYMDSRFRENDEIERSIRTSRKRA